MKAQNLEDRYELCPMQEGMLFHTQLEPRAGYYVEQFCCRLHGRIDPKTFQAAWQKIVDRHAILRTSVLWNERKQAVQGVHRQVAVHLHQLDWRDLAADEQESCLKSLLRADRCRSFDVERPPLMRLCLIRSAEDQFHFLWTFHHVLLDGWSYLIVLKEVFSLYDALAQGKDLYFQPPRPYRDYLAWRQHLDLTQAAAFWQRALKGLKVRTMLARVCPPSRAQIEASPSVDPSDDDQGQQQFRLTNGMIAALRSLARQHRLTLNTLVQGAWAILLHRCTGDTDVLFGATVAGRPPALAGIESMVGVFINTLPVRVSLSGRELLLPWLAQLQQQQIELRQYECTPLVLIQKCVELPPGAPLYESILVYENVPFDASLWERFQSLKIRDVRFISKTHYPLTLSVVAGTDLSVSLSYERRRVDDGAIRRLLGHLRAVLEGIAENPHRCLGELLRWTSAERQQPLVEWSRPRGQGSEYGQIEFALPQPAAVR